MFAQFVLASNDRQHNPTADGIHRPQCSHATPTAQVRPAHGLHRRKGYPEARRAGVAGSVADSEPGNVRL